jgi:GNAT superfamily N-acetyltransferase
VNQIDRRDQVVTATHEDEEYLAELIAGALVAAKVPVVQYLVPDESQQLAVLTSVARLELENVRVSAGIVRTDAGREAVALWIYHRGAGEPEPELDSRLKNAAGPAAPRFLAYRQALDARRRDLLGDQPHWQLQIIATRPDQQGRGFGRLLVRDQLAVIDRVGEPTYAEAPTEEHRRALQSLGFRPKDPSVVLGDGRTHVFPALHRPTHR